MTNVRKQDLTQASQESHKDYSQYICRGAHCKCLNQDGSCKNYHNGDHTCPSSSRPPTDSHKDLKQQIEERLKAMYFSAWPITNLDTDTTEPPIPLEDALSYHLPALLALFEEAIREAQADGVDFVLQFMADDPKNAHIIKQIKAMSENQMPMVATPFPVQHLKTRKETK